MARFSKLSVFVLSLLANQIYCWKSQGHFLVARIAYDQLQKNSPQSLSKANDLLKVLTTSDPVLVSAERDYPFVESASFADIIKYGPGQFQSDWHFVNYGYYDQGGNSSNYPQFRPGKENITEAIRGIVSWLKNENKYKDHFVYNDTMKVAVEESKAKSYALRLLIHYVGDIHQPLHAMSRVNPQYPKGDVGGNAFPVPNTKDADNLHSVWDSVIYEFYKNDRIPYETSPWNKLGNSTANLTKLHASNISQSQIQNLNFTQWAYESFLIAKQNAYQGISENKTLPDSYIAKNNLLTEKQIVLGGLRLAYLMQNIFKNDIQIQSIQDALSQQNQPGFLK